MAGQFVQVRLFAVGGYPFLVFVTKQEYGAVLEDLNRYLSNRYVSGKERFLCIDFADTSHEMVIDCQHIMAFEIARVDKAEDGELVSIDLVSPDTLQDV